MVAAALNDLTTDVARIRSVLLRELETVNNYEELARQAASEEVRAFFLHLAAEEKEHVAEATLLLRRLDADQDAHFKKDFPASHFQAAAAKPHPAPRPGALRVPADPRRVIHALPSPPSHYAGGLTVGSLRRNF